ncbi:thymus-specific serine protease [Tiliqua scincoides]|uniref:thymus-specific serine protease n=1 Tax=Tiliqua scincoides TaxID=71010 RepID=UPI003461D562
MGSPFARSSLGIFFILLLSWAEAGKNFRLLRQHVLKQQEERAMREAYRRLKLTAQDPSHRIWNSVIEGTILQPLDHFNRQNPLTLNQRFWVHDGYWKQPGGPIFLYIGGESSLSQFAILSGHHVEMAEKYGALLVALEHRFYGASINPDGLEDHNLWFLSSQQALLDLVSFHRYVTQKYSLTPNNTWICFGGSYPGSLAAWFRLKFPHLVFAAVASSAPVKAQLDFTGYNQVVGASLRNPVVGGSKECLEAVAEAFSTVDSLLRAGELDRLAKDFLSCEPLEGPDDYTLLVSNLADNFMGTVQYNDEGIPSANVRLLCGLMTNRSAGSTYQRLIATSNMFLDNLNTQCMQNSHQQELQNLRNTNISVGGIGERQWFFQTCTEFGYYQTCENSSCPFSQFMTLQYSLDICKQVFNISSGSIQEAVSFTNDDYGADHPKASHVLFVNGDIDPWHALGVLKNQSHSEVAILINGTAHAADMMPSSPADPLPLVEARRRINFQVGTWLKLARDIHGAS